VLSREEWEESELITAYQARVVALAADFLVESAGCGRYRSRGPSHHARSTVNTSEMIGGSQHLVRSFRATRTLSRHRRMTEFDPPTSHSKAFTRLAYRP
jgi:hypothetical protein